MSVPAYMNWSGGKDSALALYHALRDPHLRVTDLFTSVNTHYQRVSMHGVRLELLDMQAQRLGLPLTKLELPENPSMDDYERLMSAALTPLREKGIQCALFGDIFLEDLRQYRESQLKRLGLAARFPLWQRPSADVLREFIDLGFQAVVVCVNDKYLDSSFCGRLLDAEFLRDLPPNVDACGENGEYHSFVFAAPYFATPIAFEYGEIVRRTYQRPASEQAPTVASPSDPYAAGFWYCDLLAASDTSVMPR